MVEFRLFVACEKWERLGSYSVERLRRERGYLRLVDFVSELTAACSRAMVSFAVEIYHYPFRHQAAVNLVGLANERPLGFVVEGQSATRALRRRVIFEGVGFSSAKLRGLPSCPGLEFSRFSLRSVNDAAFKPKGASRRRTSSIPCEALI
jgi:hypothetical protein